MADPRQTSPDAGPDHPPPSLPPGWTAQWDGSSRKYYFVQISTGVSTWDVPSSPAPHAVLTPQAVSPLPTTQGDYLSAGGGGYAGDRVPTPSSDRGNPGHNEDGDRGLGSTAFNLLAGKSGQHGSGGHQSGLGGLAQTLLSSGSSHGGSGGSSHGGSAGKIVGQLAGSLLSGKKPSSHSGGGGSGSGHQSGGGGLVGSLLGGLGGHHGHQQQNYGYSTSGSNTSYSGQAPPAQYRPPSQQSVNVGGSGSQHPPPVSHAHDPHPYGSSSQPPAQYHPPISAAPAAHPYPGQPMNYSHDQRPQQPPHQPYHPHQAQYGSGHDPAGGFGPGPQPPHQGAYQGHPPGPGGSYYGGHYPPASAAAAAPGPGPYSELSGSYAPYQQPYQPSPYPGPNQTPGHGPPPSLSPYPPGPPSQPYPGPAQGQYAAAPPSQHHHNQQYSQPPANAPYGSEPHGYGQYAAGNHPPPSAPAWK